MSYKLTVTFTPPAPHLRALAPLFAARLAAILAGLAALIWARYSRHPFLSRIHRRITNAAHRVTAAMQRLAAGRPPRIDPRRNRERASTTQPKIPNEHAWLPRDLKHEVAAIRNQLEALLAEPGIAELLAASPYASRILTPIRHALGLTPPPKHPRPTPPPAPITAEALSYLWPFRNPPPQFRKTT